MQMACICVGLPTNGRGGGRGRNHASRSELGWLGRKSGAYLGLHLTTPDHQIGALVAGNLGNTSSQSDVVIWGDRSSTCCLLSV